MTGLKHLCNSIGFGIKTTDDSFHVVQLARRFAGAVLSFYEQVPLAWLLGSMVAASIAA